jgi:hypothetical protein
MIRFSRKLVALPISTVAALALVACATPLNLSVPKPFPEAEMPRRIQEFSQDAARGYVESMVKWSIFLAEGWTKDGKPDWKESQRYLMLAVDSNSIAARGEYGNRLALGRYGLKKDEAEAKRQIDRAYEMWLQYGKPGDFEASRVSYGLLARGLMAYYGPKDYKEAFHYYCLALSVLPGNEPAVKNMKVIDKTPSQCNS